jgi:pyruvate dehydrogenase E2 component (dihydrolipoamide acetyltransferase)
VTAARRSRAPEPRLSPSSSNGGFATDRVKASPVARRLAAELGVELGALVGSGPGGRIVKADVHAAAQTVQTPSAPAQESAAKAPHAAATGPAAPPAGSAKGTATTHKITRLQQTVARRMAESKATIPDFTLFVDVDMTACVELRAQLKDLGGAAPSYNDMIVKASAVALREHPRANGSYRDDSFEHYERVNVGIAVAGDDALVVPTIFDADAKSLGQIARDSRRLAAAVRDGTITPADLAGGTFTVSNLGMFGIDRFVAIVNPGQAAILSVGAMSKRAVVDDQGDVVARDVLTLGLVSDHRVLYGSDAARFLTSIRKLLERPLAMAL